MREGDAGGYRPDIDGLRAVAIVPVVLYHLGFFGIALGGFVGVDVFFVISGFLISQIILRDVVGGTYSVIGFYARRARRILPALLAMMAGCLVASVVTSFPLESERLGHSMLAALGFGSNILFFAEAGYFGGALQGNPLLHTWSLAVEEQFYIVFPLLLLLMTRRVSRRGLFAALAVLALASLALSAWQVVEQPEAAFYLLPSRAWELLLGSLLAVGVVPSLRVVWVRDIEALLGLALIGYSVLTLNPSGQFPGPAALPAVIGAALVVHAGQGDVGRPGLVARVLGWGPVRFVGLISYSLYLWHWPIIVFAGRVTNVDSMPARIALLGISLATAAASWRFIEQPFRRGRFRLADQRTLVVALAACCAVAGLALQAAGLHRWLNPAPAAAEAVLAYDGDKGANRFREGVCFLSTGTDRDGGSFDDDSCLAPSATQPNVLVLGDSYAAHLVYGLQQQHPEVHVLQATASGCRAVLPLSGTPRCTALLGRVIDDVIPRGGIDGVIVSSRWVGGDPAGVQRLAAAVLPYVRYVVVSGPNRRYDAAVPRLLAVALRDGVRDLRGYLDTHAIAAERTLDQQFAASAWPRGVTYFSAYRAVTNPRCTPFPAPRTPVQFDDGHLTGEGSKCVAAQLELPAR